MRLLLLLALGIPVFAQLPFGVGLKGGFADTDAFSSFPGNRLSPRFTIGPYAEINVPFLISVESGVMIKRFQYGLLGGRLEKGTIYDVPVLLKKKIGPFPVKPFLSGGITMRKASNIDWKPGLTLATGISVNALLIKVEPEVRYTRFGSGGVPIGRNQVELLVGVRF